MTVVKTRKKLIEVALPLEAINVASAREKSIRHGHPSTLHLWWARRPLAAARAVIFAQMVDDPSEYVDTLLNVPETRRAAQRELKKRLEIWGTQKAAFEAATGLEDVAVPEPGAKPTLEDCAAEVERQRLFRLIEDLVKWENTTNDAVLEKARTEIWQSWRRACADNADDPRAKDLFDRHKLPAFHDPFAGGGSLPLEAQRLGLEAYASDLNPVAVLINKAMIEIPPKFAGRPPVNPKRDLHKHWKGTQGLAEDVRYYGQLIHDEAERRIGHLYPTIEITAEMARQRPDLKPLIGNTLTGIAWLWARTVKSPNPAFRNVDVPLISTFMLSTKVGKEAYVEPIIEGSGYRFVVRVGMPKNTEAAAKGTKLSRANFKCVMSGTPVSGDYIKTEGKARQVAARLMAIVAEGKRGRIYLSPTAEHEAAAHSAQSSWRPEGEIATRMTGGNCTPYGLTSWGDLFTERQLFALVTFSDLVGEAIARVRHDAAVGGLPDDPKPLRDGGNGAVAYAEAVGTYLAFAIDRMAMTGNSLVRWNAVGEKAQHCFGRQALPMLWDFAEPNFFASATGSLEAAVFYSYDPLNWMDQRVAGIAEQADAAIQTASADKLVSTDPPYYDNIAYGDLSDFFYVWLRHSLRDVFPDLFATLAVPKVNELVATPYRHGGKEKAEEFFLAGMTRAMHQLAELPHPAFPVTIYYAFKQSETEGDSGTSSTGWETFLDATIRAGLAVRGTWPIRTEMRTRQVAMDTNALASSIVLVCRPRAADAETVTRRAFVATLKAELPAALRHLQAGNIAPVDLAQAAIGPGMGVYSRYAKVLDAEGNPVSVRDALVLINATLDEALAEQEGDFDADSRWALAWFEQNGFAEGEYGVAEMLSKAKNTSVGGLAEAGILESRRGKVRLLKPEELDADWNPAINPRLIAWATVHHLVRALGAGGEQAAADLVAKLGARAEIARELAYRLYTVCERKKRVTEALTYNGLVQSWPEIMRLARESAGSSVQAEMLV